MAQDDKCARSTDQESYKTTESAVVADARCFYGALRVRW